MTIKELKEIMKYIDERHDGELVSVLLDLPSIGPRAYSKIIDGSIGFDWDKGLQFKTEHKLVPKNEKQSIYELAFDLLCWIATKPVKKESYEIRTAKRILLKYGYTQEKLDSYQKICHPEVKK